MTVIIYVVASLANGSGIGCIIKVNLR